MGEGQFHRTYSLLVFQEAASSDCLGLGAPVIPGDGQRSPEVGPWAQAKL